MHTFSSASWTGRLAASASEYATTVLMPRSRHDRRIRSAISPRFATRIFLNRFAIGLGGCPSLWVWEPVQERPDARRKEALRAERTGSYVSTQGRLTTPQMATHGQAPRVPFRTSNAALTGRRDGATPSRAVRGSGWKPRPPT